MPFVNSMKSLIFDLAKILLRKRLVLTYSLFGKVMYYQILLTEFINRAKILAIGKFEPPRNNSNDTHFYRIGEEGSSVPPPNVHLRTNDVTRT